MSPRKLTARPWLRPGIILLVAVLIALGIATAATKLMANADSSKPGRSGAGGARPSSSSSCPELVLPAYFADWTPVFGAKPPADLILDLPNGVGAGTAPDPSFTAQIRQAESLGITILGYSSTVDGLRPLADVEADVRDYKAWYGVTHIFLDRVSGQQAQLGYYTQLADYIHQVDGPGTVWLNPGDYPDQGYMAIGDVVMVFEGTYAQYATLQVPSWATSYPAAKYAHTIYDTPEADLSSALNLARERHATHVYVTDGTGGNPYAGVPSYWSSELSDSCGT